MRFWGLCKRNLIESLRDPITIVLGLGLPLFLLVLFSLINMAVDFGGTKMFDINELTPGIVVFSFSMLMISEANLIATDRDTSLFSRLKTLPLTTTDFMLAYSAPFLLIALGQYVVTFIIAFCFGLPWTPHVFTSFLLLFPMAILYIALGLMMGVSLTLNQTVGMGNGIIILAAMLSGAWMPIEIMGDVISTIATIFPFYNAVALSRQLINGLDFEWYRLGIALGWTAALLIISWFVSRHKLKTK